MSGQDGAHEDRGGLGRAIDRRRRGRLIKGAGTILMAGTTSFMGGMFWYLADTVTTTRDQSSDNSLRVGSVERRVDSLELQLRDNFDQSEANREFDRVYRTDRDQYAKHGRLRGKVQELDGRVSKLESRP